MKVTELSTTYNSSFVPDKAYLDSLPDLQNAPYETPKRIERVGIDNFKLPLKIRQKDGGTQETIVHITGMVSLEADQHGINMSRILRTFYDHKDSVFDMDYLCEILLDYKKKLNSFDAHIIIDFEYRMWQESLRSVTNGQKNGGWQYYKVTFDVCLDKDGVLNKRMELDFLYSSACPCSTALSKHAAETRDVYAIPHSQRSKARLTMEFDEIIWIEDLVEMLRKALATEVQVFVKREDEQAFAELNGAHTKFVEDAVRIISLELDKFSVPYYKVIASHWESLHAHEAIAVISNGAPKVQPVISLADIKDVRF